MTLRSSTLFERHWLTDIYLRDPTWAGSPFGAEPSNLRLRSLLFFFLWKALANSLPQWLGLNYGSAFEQIETEIPLFLPLRKKLANNLLQWLDLNRLGVEPCKLTLRSPVDFTLFEGLSLTATLCPQISARSDMLVSVGIPPRSPSLSMKYGHSNWGKTWCLGFNSTLWTIKQLCFLTPLDLAPLFQVPWLEEIPLTIS